MGEKQKCRHVQVWWFFKAFIDFSLHSSFNQLSVKNEECIFNLCKNVLSVSKVLSVAIKHFSLQLCIHFLKPVIPPCSLVNFRKVLKFHNIAKTSFDRLKSSMLHLVITSACILAYIAEWCYSSGKHLI